ncbi:MAG: outer membrane beta-barrel protein [Pirellulales bacterium]|nr:outer membrane beta-barrel protein [Pirellulales bacterium]
MTICGLVWFGGGIGVAADAEKAKDSFFDVPLLDDSFLSSDAPPDEFLSAERPGLEAGSADDVVEPAFWAPLLGDGPILKDERPMLGEPATGEVFPAPACRRPGQYSNAELSEDETGLLRMPSLFGPAGRHRGVGQPLLCESWRYRPFGAGWFMGLMQGSPMIDDWAGANGGFFGGYRLTWDYDHYWGCEFRYGFGSLPQWDSARAKIAQQQDDTLHGLGPDDPRRQRYDKRRDMDINVWDVSFVYYPWGDSAWRPYALLGLGGARIGFQDRLGKNYTNRVLAMPMGLGVKYRWNSRWALRVEVLDNIIFGANGVRTLNNLSLTAGVEVRFGGTRKAYWPYNPGRHYW